MRTSIATVCLSGTLAEKLRAAADAGFDGVEIFEQDLTVSPHSPEQIRQRAADLGLSLDLFQPFRDLEGVEEEQFQANLRRLEAKFALMNRLGIDTILLCSNVGTAIIDDDELFATQLRRAGELAERHDVRIAYEALAWGRFVNDFEHAHRVVELADHPRVGTCLDTFHILSRGWSTDAVESIPADRIFFVQLADAPRLSMDVLSWSRHHRVFPGEGDFDLVKFMRHLARSGYDGPVSLEIFNDSFRKADVARTAVDGRRSLRWLEDRTWHALSDAGEAEAGQALDLVPLPDVAETEGLDFVGIATGRLGETMRVLHQLGFRLGGHHRSRPEYQVWIQGTVRIVIGDRGPTGAPTAITSLCFSTPDPAAAEARAHGLQAKPVPGERAAGVCAPDGTEVLFTGPAAGSVPEWLAEFGMAEDDLGDRSLITGVDHVNLAQPWQYYDETVLFYTSLMALEAQGQEEFPSPIGLIRNQIMRSANDRVRLLLSVAPEDGEQGDFLAAAYPEHIAFTTEDILAVARRARQRGLAFLPVPENYYDDLQARFELDPVFLAELRENDLLYDRDAHGEFLHFYTGTLGTMFFEVIERRGGFRGWGENNAPVRLAAQYRRIRDLERGVPQ
ncbi:sugar phosphate isomerase/epimerase and 4-hydroxyphenylpyruvate domain-containing protein [Corynebacterium hylobatis]|uniref:3-dehydroshikimate dehydratase n=1 Tax=Corynebacterium hylobatis TaxID=1859290 RepID=A0A430HZ45_9CORY|nr:sugar phosphate isomerase/epimerase and 4-hydroxyphenylpyruvate domain-containing protein [Corynebacterium hylobatis]RSZ64207.1 sugar phosphate isomerase/epimerase and 4-hydroxyphenylpyruvate domain-containing protein [Corynebacterium hylobatis]